MELGGSQSVPLCQSQNYFVNLHLEIVSPNGDYQKHVICQVSKNKIWPRSVIHGQLGLIFILIFAKLSKLSESKLAFWIKNILGMIFLKKVGDGASYCWWCWSWCSMVFGGACDVNSSSPPHWRYTVVYFVLPPTFPTLTNFTLLNNTLAIHF